MLKHIEQQARELEVKQKLLERKDRDIAWRDAKIEKITFELARLKRWKYGAKSEAMTAEQRQMFQDTLLEDEADLRGATRRAAGRLAPRRRPHPGRPGAPPPGAARASAPRGAPPRARRHHLHDAGLRHSR
jgi:transposase